MKTLGLPGRGCDHRPIDETLLAGTESGLHVLGARPSVELAGRTIHALTPSPGGLLALADGDEVMRRDEPGRWEAIARLERGGATCMLPVGEEILVGTEGAHLLRLGTGSERLVEGFESVAGRESWFTPWGGPPATRWLARASEGAIYANVHVGGIPRSDDDGSTWRPTIEIGFDAHQVICPAERPGLVLVAGARGLARSDDGGGSWRVSSAGLRASYARAVALAGDQVLIGASDGPRGGHAAVYRRPLESGRPFERCAVGLPDWFGGNIETGCLTASGELAAFAADGTVHLSRDAGATWSKAAELPSPARCLLLAAELDRRWRSAPESA